MEKAGHSLASSLEGVQAVRGALVFCRDAPAFEMVMRMTAVRDSRTPATVLKGGAAQQSGDSSEGRRLFVRHTRDIEVEVQRWLDPFRDASTPTSKRGPRLVDSPGSEDDSDSGSDVSLE